MGAYCPSLLVYFSNNKFTILLYLGIKSTDIINHFGHYLKLVKLVYVAFDLDIIGSKVFGVKYSITATPLVAAFDLQYYMRISS